MNKRRKKAKSLSSMSNSYISANTMAATGLPQLWKPLNLRQVVISSRNVLKAKIKNLEKPMVVKFLSVIAQLEPY